MLKEPTYTEKSPVELPQFIEVEERIEFTPSTDERKIRNVIVNGLNSKQLIFEDDVVEISADVSPHYLGQLVSALQMPLILQPGLPPKRVSETEVFRDKVLPTAAEFMKKLEAVTKIINIKHANFAGVLGDPITDVQFAGKDYEVAYRKYQRGAIYVLPHRGEAFEVHGAVYQKYLALGAEASFLGFPETDELSTLFGTGRFNHFQGGSVYWSPQTRAQSIHGVVRDRWWALNGERGYLGFPISDVERGQISYFQRGNLQIQSDGSVHDYPDGVFLATSINGGHVKCSLDFWMNSRGEWRYKGHLHNDGFAGCTASVATSPRFQTADGHVFVVSAERSLGGTMDTEERNDDWDQTGNDEFISENWDTIQFAGLNVVLKTNTQIGDVLNILWPFVALAIIIFGSSGKSKVCGPYGSFHRDENGQSVPSVGWQLVDPNQNCPGPNNHDLFELK